MKVTISKKESFVSESATTSVNGVLNLIEVLVQNDITARCLNGIQRLL